MSNTIKTHTYNKVKQTMDVTFPNGSRYTYSGVSPALYEKFCGAESKGKFLYAEIKPNCSCKKCD